ncbi:MAG: type II toxin-antitoxin system RelE/ParE family toxin [Rhizobiales bacterium]|nr:type II toxin-antitoxin system RelE/ParE family toxin [Hyphomicrobiales bacterium]
MKIVWTRAALSDLDLVLAYAAEHYPSSLDGVRRRIGAVVERVARWPESARMVEERSGVRVVPLIRYPYRIFYRVGEDAVEILHLHHAAHDETD